jgi:hypothetical protein
MVDFNDEDFRDTSGEDVSGEDEDQQIWWSWGLDLTKSENNNLESEDLD